MSNQFSEFSQRNVYVNFLNNGISWRHGFCQKFHPSDKQNSRETLSNS